MENYTEINVENRNKSGLIKKLLVSLLVILVALVLLLLFFPTKKSLNPLMQDVFRNNITSMQDAAKSYFTNERLPKNEGETVKMTLSEMLELNLLLPFIDKNGNQCDVSKSYVEITREENEYILKVNLSCTDQESYIIEHIGCTDICATLGKCDETCSGANCNNTNTEKAIEYEFKKLSTSKVLTGYVCTNKEYTYDLKTGKCVKTVSKTLTEEATPVYEEKTTTIDRTYKTEEVKKYLYKYMKTVTTTKYVEDTSQPIRTYNYDSIIGYSTRKVCTGYKYFVDSTSEKLYQSTSDYKYSHTETMEIVPKDTVTTKYVVVGMDYDKCMDTCTLKPYYKVEVYKRAVSEISNTQYSNLSAVCTVEEVEVPIYGLKITFNGFVTDKIVTTQTLTEWSESKTDQTLIDQNYGYVGIRKENGTTTEKVYDNCPSDTTLSKTDETKCIKTEKVVKEYKCPTNGFTYNSNSKKCTKVTSVQETINATAQYKTVTSTVYRWATTPTLSGWTATGKTR